MGFLSKLFSSKATVAAVQRAVVQERYADAYYLAGELSSKTLEVDEAQTVARLRAEAGDGLAKMNLVEAKSKQLNGEQELADQHFDLALEYVCDHELKKEIEQARQAPVEIVTTDDSGTKPGCGTCAPAGSALVDESEKHMVEEGPRLELILLSYPPALKTRYEDRGREFVEAFLASQDGDSVQSYELFNSVNEDERDDIYWFEVGSLRARMGDMPEAKQALEQALELNPELMLAVEALVEVLLSMDLANAALGLIQQKMKTEAEAVPQCHALLVTVHARQEDWQAAAEHVRPALDGGYTDPAFISLAAMVMEKNGRLDDAEALLAKLPTGGGCRGNTNLLLAEFYLRNNLKLEQAFASFNAVAKQEPDNPRWTLRLAQTCFARQWHKDGQQLLRQLMSNPKLDAELKTVVQNLAAQHGNKDVNPR